MKRKINLIIGFPGSGKTTLGKTINAYFKHINYLSLGDFCRKNIAHNTPIGVKIKYYIDHSVRYDAAFLYDLVNRILDESGSDELLFDGLPRFVDEIIILKRILSKYEAGWCIDLRADKKICTQRCLKRNRQVDMQDLAFRLESYKNQYNDIIKELIRLDFDIIQLNANQNIETVTSDCLIRIAERDTNIG